MNNTLMSIIFSLITGVISSSLVVLYFELQQNRKHFLSRAHILERFTRELFKILTIIRIVSQLKLENKSLQDKTETIKELEKILGRNNPGILINRIANLSSDQHQYILNQLTQVQNSLSTLFSHSITHKTIEDKVSASIAEMQEWINSVLQNYIMFPEIISSKDDQTIQMMWMTSIFNLVENTFVILSDISKKQKVPEGLLRWGSHSK